MANVGETSVEGWSCLCKSTAHKIKTDTAFSSTLEALPPIMVLSTAADALGKRMFAHTCQQGCQLYTRFLEDSKLK